nr:tudor domain-containing protein 3 isoform X2 [Arachis hypogaea]
MAESRYDSDSGTLLETLRRRGWCLQENDQLKATVMIQRALAHDTSMVVDSVESELLNADLRSIGAKSLPEPSVLRSSPSSYLHGPKVLQISSVRDISKSSVDDVTRNSGGRRLLRLCLTDGHFEIIGIEYSHIPSIPDNVAPGTKICLENKVAVHNGIACLNPKALTVLGGVVQSLYEEWQMNQKYSGFSRSSLRHLEDRDAGGPPPFVKLQVGSSSGYADYKSSSSKPTAVVAEAKMKATDSHRGHTQKADISSDVNLKPKLPSEKAVDKPSTSEPRPREAVEPVPVQNQAAAQKLLQKLNQPNQENCRFKGRKHRGKGKEEDPVVYTLEEYETRKAQAKPLKKDEVSDVSRDGQLARQLQNQFNLEDCSLLD